eukprot:1156607-Pelagomonas_calceolata.AAC.10
MLYLRACQLSAIRTDLGKWISTGHEGLCISMVISIIGAQEQACSVYDSDNAKGMPRGQPLQCWLYHI